MSRGSSDFETEYKYKEIINLNNLTYIYRIRDRSFRESDRKSKGTEEIDGSNDNVTIIHLKVQTLKLIQYILKHFCYKRNRWCIIKRNISGSGLKKEELSHR